MAKYVFVTGGVVSGLGKGITASSIALLLKARGYKVFMQKFDPYINVDPGTMSPYQHGEVFVTADGSETDLDLGHYERYIDEELNYTSNMTMGKVFASVIEKERRGDFLGGTVQIVPHVTNEIKSRIYEAAHTSNADIIITEIGGTIGDIESQSFLEALRQMRLEEGIENTLYVHTTLVPEIYGSGELKTKPTQHSVIEMRGLGLQPDIIVCRTPIMLDDDIKRKISMFCSIPANHVISSPDVKNVYSIPLIYHEQGIDEIVLNHFKLDIPKINISEWENLVQTTDNLKEEIEISLVGKYVELHDAYISVVEALKHAGYPFGVKVNINWVDSESLEDPNCDLSKVFQNSKGIIIPGGFGSRGIEGMIKAAEYARTNNIPYLGLCLGMQIATIEFARNVCNLEDANSTEFDQKCKNPIIDLMSDQKQIINMGGTLRLGNYECQIKKDTLAYSGYQSDTILERHRHRYEFNNKYRETLESKGLVFSGINPQADLVEIIELPSHDHYIACQFHPEFKSRPNKPHALFKSFIEAATKRKTINMYIEDNKKIVVKHFIEAEGWDSIDSFTQEVQERTLEGLGDISSFISRYRFFDEITIYDNVTNLEIDSTYENYSPWYSFQTDIKYDEALKSLLQRVEENFRERFAEDTPVILNPDDTSIEIMLSGITTTIDETKTAEGPSLTFRNKDKK